ncbi:hypothetical protein POTOM_057222 [Populus tomentosa]|uniref:Pentatricopeptide repeat-containing protein n=1 Tax=Populus tomentosa TaxID=118781 RepID=A0A8X7XXA0_POPTO|nr:hypothetical protein POTOM_057222 [Populus tomentosa]
MAFSHYLTYSAYPSAEPVANSVSELFAADIPAQSTFMGVSAILSVVITSSTSSTDNTPPNLFERIGTLCIGHCLVFKAGLDGDEHVNHSLTTMDARCGEMGFAWKVFDEMGDRDLVSWNSMISGYSKMGFAKEAIGLFMEMREEGFEPDEMTLVNVLGRVGIWNGASNEAIVLFNGMREAGPDPDKVTMIEVLSACSTIRALDMGKWVETHASERGLQHDVYVASELIDMYAKCESLDDALRVFESMPHENEVSWNAMISALAFHGQAVEALSLFRCMSKDNGTVQSNDITFI